jgi:PEP-CTERM motif
MITKPISLRLLALVACFCLARGAQAAVLTAYGVDSSLGGSMNFTGMPQISYNQSQTQFTINLTAVNNGATTYRQVALPIEFIYPANLTATAPVGNGFKYLASENGTWADNPTTPTEELQFTGASSTDYPPISFGLQLLSPSQIIVPLTDVVNAPGGPYTAGPLSTTDSVPLIQLGDFGPGVQKRFTLTANSIVGGNFHFFSDAFFAAAVPEPSTLLLAATAGAALLFAWRRRSVLKSRI